MYFIELMKFEPDRNRIGYVITVTVQRRKQAPSPPKVANFKEEDKVILPGIE